SCGIRSIMSDQSHDDSQPEEESGEPEYEVQVVLDERITKKGIREFYVKWRDGVKKWSEDKWDQWLEESAMACPDLIAEFRERRNADLDRGRKDRSSSRTRKTAKEEKKQKKSSSKGRAERRESDDEDSDIPRKTIKPKRKKAVIESDDDDGVPRSTRSRSTVDRDEDQPSTSRVKGRKKTEVERLRLTPPPSSRRDSQEPTASSSLPPTESVRSVKRESVSPEKQREPRSAISSKPPNRPAAERKRWKKVQEKAKKNWDKQRKPSKSHALPPSAAITDETGPLFQDLPANLVKTEMHADEVVDEMERMDFDDLREPREGVSTSIEEEVPKEGEVEEEEPKEGENSRSEESTKDPLEGGDGASESMEVEEQEKEEEEGKEREESELNKTGEEELKIDEETPAAEMRVVKKEEDSMENGEETREGEGEEEEEEEFDFQSPDEPTGYDLKHTGQIIDVQTFEFDTGERMAFCRVLFRALRATQYIAASIVEEKDPMGYRSFLRRRWEEKEQARIKEGAARYRAGREAYLAAEAAAAAREAAAGSSLG
ncbi:hypothetical protein PMAYCL1PPCAC_17639, partial [Pristionchus mayeri]